MIFLCCVRVPHFLAGDGDEQEEYVSPQGPPMTVPYHRMYMLFEPGNDLFSNPDHTHAEYNLLYTELANQKIHHPPVATHIQNDFLFNGCQIHRRANSQNWHRVLGHC